MPYTIKIENEEDLIFLKRVINNLYIKMHDNISGYIEYIDCIDNLKENFDNASIEEDVIIEIIGTRSSLPPAKEEKVAKAKPKKKARKRADVASLPSFCNDHPKYGAQRAPRTECEACWDAYKTMNPTKYPAAWRKFQFTQKQNAN